VETFIVRVWTSIDEPDDAPSGGELCGVLEHIRSHVRTHFRNTDELLSLLHTLLTPTTGHERHERRL
jgi:hypothetical protein